MEAKRVPKIFISYRRDDTSGHVNSLHDTLARHFGAEYVFRDIRDIGPGKVFVEAIKAEIISSDILLAVIGKDWQAITERKLSANEEDYVRLEIATALDSGRNIIVVPVLVEGARVPHKRELPADLEQLAGRQAFELSDRRWGSDVGELIEDLEAAFAGGGEGKPGIPPREVKPSVPNSLYSLFGGSVAGLVTGTILGAVYTYEQRVEWSRIILIGLYGMFAGAMLSIFINSGITWCSKLLNNSPYSKIIGGTFGGALGGIAAAIAGGFGFAWLDGGPVDTVQVITAVAFSTIFITLGILLPDVTGEWHKRVLIIVILACVTLVCLFITRWFLSVIMPLEKSLTESSGPTSRGVLILGLICGLMSGIQAGSALFVYYRFKDKAESADP